MSDIRFDKQKICHDLAVAYSLRQLDMQVEKADLHGTREELDCLMSEYCCAFYHLLRWDSDAIKNYLEGNT